MYIKILLKCLNVVVCQKIMNTRRKQAEQATEWGLGGSYYAVLRHVHYRNDWYKNFKVMACLWKSKQGIDNCQQEMKLKRESVMVWYAYRVCRHFREFDMPFINMEIQWNFWSRIMICLRYCSQDYSDNSLVESGLYLRL